MCRFGGGVSNQKKGYKIRLRFPPRAPAGGFEASRQGGEAMFVELGGEARVTTPEERGGDKGWI